MSKDLTLDEKSCTMSCEMVNRFRRFVPCTVRAVDGDSGRSFTGVIATSDVLDVGWGIRERLELSEENTRMDVHTVLLNHNPSLPIGRSLGHRFNDDGTIEADFEISATEPDVLAKIRDGTLTGISIGYNVDRTSVTRHTDEQGEYYSVGRQTIREFSVVSVPADSGATIAQRDFYSGFEPQQRKEADMPEESKVEVQSQPVEVTQRSELLHKEDYVKQERERVVKLTRQADKAKGHVKDVDSLVRNAIEVGTSSEEFADTLLSEIEKRQAATKTVDVPKKEMGQYRVGRLMHNMLTGEKSLETEISDAANASPGNRYVPWTALKTRQITVADEPELVATETDGSAFIDALRDNSVALQVGVRTLSGLVGNVKIPRQTNHSGLTFKAANQASGDADVTFDEIELKMKTASGGISVSRETLKQSVVAIESILQEDLRYGVAQVTDTAVFTANGTSPNPAGVTSTAFGATKVVVKAPGASAPNILDWAKVVEFQQKIQAEGVNFGAFAWVMSAVRIAQARTVKKDAGSGIFLMNEGNTLNGYPVYQKNALQNTMIFGDFSQVILGVWGSGFEMKVDEATLAATGGIIYRVFYDIDVNVRQSKGITFSDVS